MKHCIYIISTLFLYSCTGDCPDVEVTEVEWVTYQDVKKIRRSYIPEYEILDMDISYYNKYYNTNVSLRIKNLDSKNNLKFKVNKNYGYTSKPSSRYKSNYSKKIETYTIFPKGEKSINFNINTNGYYFSKIKYDFLNFEKVHEIKYDTIVYDSLIITKRIANTCKENTEAINQSSQKLISLYKDIGRIEPSRRSTDTIYNSLN
ncbi:hypothetical protein GO491_07190 [Flavobacteriaceae bacterium Ap0902]|nr:hypothetical protein [Flavobacteriaceae bacterium Ap0902]